MNYPSIADVALKDRGDGANCNANRIPTGAFPVYATTLRGTVDASGNATLEFPAERDTLFTTLSAYASDGSAFSLSATYCNTKYLVNSSSLQWVYCCQRKPIFLVGVRDTKRLKFTISGGTADAEIRVSLSGFQGNGCCG